MRDFDPTAGEFISSGFIANSRPGGLMYDPGTLFSAGASILGGALGSDSAGDATQAQIAATDRATGVQEAARVQNRQDLMPWTQGGGLAQNELLRRLGINVPAQSREQIRAQLLPQYTTATQQPVYGNQPPVFGAVTNDGDNGVTGQWNQENNWYQQQSPEGGGQAQSTVDEAGLNAAIEAMYSGQPSQANTPGFGSLTKQFDQTDLNNDLVYQNGLQFGLNTGINQLNNRAAATGGYGSGAALKALTRYGNDYATTKTAGAYDRSMGQKNQLYSFLQGQSAQGQSAASGVGAAGINTAAGIAGNINAAGNANAAGSIAGANALGGGIAGATNAFQWNQLLSKGAGTTGTPSAYRSGSGLMGDLNSYGVF